MNLIVLLEHFTVCYILFGYVCFYYIPSQGDRGGHKYCGQLSVACDQLKTMPQLQVPHSEK